MNFHWICRHLGCFFLGLPSSKCCVQVNHGWPCSQLKDLLVGDLQSTSGLAGGKASKERPPKQTCFRLLFLRVFFDYLGVARKKKRRPHRAGNICKTKGFHTEERARGCGKSSLARHT